MNLVEWQHLKVSYMGSMIQWWPPFTLSHLTPKGRDGHFCPSSYHYLIISTQSFSMQPSTFGHMCFYIWICGIVCQVSHSMKYKYPINHMTMFLLYHSPTFGHFLGWEGIVAIESVSRLYGNITPWHNSM
jgi:hypothetical protein